MDESVEIEGVFDERVCVERKVLSNVMNKQGGGVKNEERRKKEQSKVVFKDVDENMNGGSEAKEGENVKEECSARCEADAKSEMLLKIGAEFEELKEAHRRGLMARGKLIRRMERELEGIKKQIEAEKKKEMEEFKKCCEEEFFERRRKYREKCRKKVCEYKASVDEMVKALMADVGSKCRELVKGMYRKRAGNG
ncbi:hypothetical protein HK407_01g00980 [Ordospora pajunii]|uniref:uncharacterized protein n=1 Tax=Ordospora pajunii TaxID=3039483 RepID=UPI0029528AA2|nr:uncharacterized protein HK407_01g00980 [Ordospora pajunii]KAH9412205.1 hypothetical protein HK407_01g00980 [Ordospora pajunii]